MILNTKGISILILAAGNSSRLGQSKQLISVQGKPLLLKSVQEAMDTQVENITVVLGAQAEKHKKVIDTLPVEIVINSQWEKGMGSSLKVGLKNLTDPSSQMEAVLIMVCDQPFLTAEHLKNIITCYKKTGADIVTSFYNQTRGVPALFKSNLFPKLAQLNDAEGARKIIQTFSGFIAEIPFEKGEIDLDTPEDLKRLISGS